MATNARRRIRSGTAIPTLVVLAALVMAPACADGPSIPSYEMTDLPTPTMFLHLASGVDRAFVLELPDGPVNRRFDLALEDVTTGEVLRELVRLDPTFQASQRADGVLVMSLAGKPGEESPFSRRVDSFEGSGGLGEMLKGLIAASGLSLTIQGPTPLGRRAVNLDVDDAVLRDVLADAARQAGVGLILRSNAIDITVIKIQDG